MPIVKVDMVGKQDPQVKKEFMDFVADLVCSNTSTLKKNIFVYINEWDPENCRKTSPVVMIDWTMMPDRTDAVKQKIMVALTDRLVEMTGADKNEVVVIFTDIPLKNASVGGVTRQDNPDL